MESIGISCRNILHSDSTKPGTILIASLAIVNLTRQLNFHIPGVKTTFLYLFQCSSRALCVVTRVSTVSRREVGKHTHKPDYNQQLLFNPILSQIHSVNSVCHSGLSVLWLLYLDTAHNIVPNQKIYISWFEIRIHTMTLT